MAHIRIFIDTQLNQYFESLGAWCLLISAQQFNCRDDISEGLSQAQDHTIDWIFAHKCVHALILERVIIVAHEGFNVIIKA